MHILLAEDDRCVADLVCCVLEDFHHSITVVPSAVEAITAIGEAYPHLVLTNVELAGPGGGDQIVQYLRYSDIPVILFTAYGPYSHEVKRCLELGAAAYLEKPFTISDLCELVARYTVDQPASATVVSHYGRSRSL